MICIIGTFVGNNIDNAEPWTPIIEKIKAQLKIWAKSHPTIKGKHLIIQIQVAGRTQYLIKAQRMPKHI